MITKTINTTKIGKKFLKELQLSGHLVIESAQVRGKPGGVANDLREWDEGIVISLSADMADRGRFMVESHKGGMFNFRAVDNLFHEISHAYHYLKGDFASGYTDGVGNWEVQSMNDTNIFRDQLYGSGTDHRVNYNNSSRQ